MKRTFIAVPVAAGEILKGLMNSLRQQLPDEDIKWVAAENLHVTLKFLGDTPEEAIPQIIVRLEEVAAAFPPASGWLRGVDFFSVQRQPSVLFTRLEELPALELIARQLETALEPLGFLPETRRFRAHLTLARIRQLRNKERFFRVVRPLKELEIQPVPVNEVLFYESFLRSQGPVYKPLKRVVLTGNWPAGQ